MEIIKISAMGIVTAFCVLLLREQKGEIAMLVGIAGGCLILAAVLEYCTQIFSVLAGFAQKTGIPAGIYKTVLKIIAIGYIADFSAGIVEDTGQRALAEKIILAGKVLIMIMSLPILTMLMETISGMWT